MKKPKKIKIKIPDMYAVDFGTGAALQIWGPDGTVSKRALSLPRVPGGKTPRDEFIMILDALLKLGDVVVESPTIGSSGAEVRDVINLVDAASHTPGVSHVLYTVSARSVKNYRRDNGLEWHKGARYVRDGSPPPVMMELHEQAAVHVEDAEIIYRLATETPHRLRVWHIAEPCPRIHSSVRPMDKRGYKDDRSEAFMALLPPFSSLPADIADVVRVKEDYSRSMVMPFAMALSEPWWAEAPREEQRNQFLKILGAYDHGYPSFYRRMTVAWMHEVAKITTGAFRMDEITPEQRKVAWRMTQKQLRTLFHLSTS